MKIIRSFFIILLINLSFSIAAGMEEQHKREKTTILYGLVQKETIKNKYNKTTEYNYNLTGFAQGALTAAGIGLACCYYYGAYHGFQFVIEKTPQLFSNLSNFVKSSYTKVSESSVDLMNKFRLK